MRPLLYTLIAVFVLTGLIFAFVDSGLLLNFFTGLVAVTSGGLAYGLRDRRDPVDPEPMSYETKGGAA